MPALLKGISRHTFRPSFIFPDAKAGDQLGFSSFFKQRKALHGKTARVIVWWPLPAASMRPSARDLAESYRNGV